MPFSYSAAGRIGAFRTHALNSALDTTAEWRAASATALEQRLLAEIDPQNQLPPAERAKRLKHAKKAHFARLAMLSAKARRARKASK